MIYREKIVLILVGPTSLLLRCKNFGRVVVEPLPMHVRVYESYKEHGIEFINTLVEEYKWDQVWDEVWDYNVLTHVTDPMENYKRFP